MSTSCPLKRRLKVDFIIFRTGEIEYNSQNRYLKERENYFLSFKIFCCSSIHIMYLDQLYPNSLFLLFPYLLPPTAFPSQIHAWPL